MRSTEYVEANEVKRALIDACVNEQVTKIGIFRVLKWLDEKACKRAQEIIRKTLPENRDGHFWAKYFGCCGGVWEFENTGVTRGLHTFLQQAAGISPFVSPAASTDGVFGGPASATGYNKGFLGVGNGLIDSTITAATAVGATSATLASAANFAANDWVMFEDSTTSQQQGTNPELIQIASVSTNTLTLALPLRYAHAINTYVVRVGSASAADLPGVASGVTTSKAYRAIDASFPTEALTGGKATLLYQSTFATSEAQFAWNEGLVGAVAAANTPPATATATFPGTPTAIVLAGSVWYPSPLDKGATPISMQYSLAIA